MTIKKRWHKPIRILLKNYKFWALPKSLNETELVIRATNYENLDFEGSEELYHKYDDKLEGLFISINEDLIDGLMVFTGDQQSSFTYGGFIALVNLEAQEITVLGAGYCQ